jgi:hypothetical protein
MYKNTIDKKPVYKRPDGKILRDLTASIFDFNANSFVTYKAYKVPAEYVMRPDLISQAVYNNIEYTEMILKFNGISNPFTMNKDDIILIPGLEGVKKRLKGKGSLTSQDQADNIRKSYKYIDPTKKPNRDPDLDNYDRRKLKEGALPPNIAEAGTSQIIYRNGRVYFGENIGTSACLKNGMSSSEFLTRVIKSKQQ